MTCDVLVANLWLCCVCRLALCCELCCFVVARVPGVRMFACGLFGCYMFRRCALGGEALVPVMCAWLRCI